MKKVLIHEKSEAIKARKQYADELVKTVNDLLISYKTKHNWAGQKIDHNFALQLLSDPVTTMDEIIQINAPFKPVAGKPVDVKRLAELVGIDREGFIRDFTVIRPGTKDRFNTGGIRELMNLRPGDKELLFWEDGQFILNQEALEEQYEKFRVYAETPEQIKEFTYWQELSEILNRHLDRKAVGTYENVKAGQRKYLDTLEINQISDKLGLILKNGRFAINEQVLAKSIDLMKVN